MNLVLTEGMTFSSIEKVLKEKLPYKIELKKNPVARFEYIQVYKSAYVGVWVRIHENKKKVQLIKTIPSTMARALFGGLIAILIASGAQNRLKKEIAGVLMSEFNTKAM